MISQALKRLWHDERGNTLALAAAVTIPLLGLIGSGVDLSRTYLAKNKLQQACDSGVIGGRKVMTTTVDAAVTSEVRKFVNFNFPQGTLETTAFAIDPTEGAERAVDLTLATRVPTGVMKIFGISGLDIRVSCTGRQDFINTDIMLVLDTTLSMNCLATEINICEAEKTGSKIIALRAAVVEFYRSLRSAQTRLEASGLRLRYGIVPYSVTVNTGRLLAAKNASYIRTAASYQQCAWNGNNGSCGTVTLQPFDQTTFVASTNWGGCIEERQTVQTIGSSSGYTPPTGALDLNIDSAPTSDVTTKWAPYDPVKATAKSSQYIASYGTTVLTDACPAPARLFAPFATETDLNTYLNTMTADGQTYLDTGLIWGARLFSPTGLWAAENPTVFNGFPVNRHMIFMTDGDMDPELDVYSAYGIERFSSTQGGRRVTSGATVNGNDSTAQNAQKDSHVQRLRMMCNKIKSMDISLWVIQFGVAAGASLNPELLSCASSPTQAFRAGDSAQLNAQFKQIGESIGALRLSQ